MPSGFIGNVVQDQPVKEPYSDLQPMRSTLESSLTAGFEKDQTPQTLDQFIESSPYMTDMLDNANEMLDGIQATITTITDGANEDAVDTGALVGLLESSFETVKNKALDSMLASSQKASLEMDAYLGSSASDARSAVRRNIASGINTNLVRQTQQGIAQLYGGHVDKVIQTTLAGAQINAQAKRDASGALVGLTQAAANIMLGTNSALVDTYAKTISVNNDIMKIQAGLYSDIIGIETQRYIAGEQQTTARLTNENFMGRGVSSQYNTDYAQKLRNLGYGQPA